MNSVESGSDLWRRTLKTNAINSMASFDCNSHTQLVLQTLYLTHLTMPHTRRPTSASCYTPVHQRTLHQQNVQLSERVIFESEWKLPSFRVRCDEFFLSKPRKQQQKIRHALPRHFVMHSCSENSQFIRFSSFLSLCVFFFTVVLLANNNALTGLIGCRRANVLSRQMFSW